MTLPHEKDDEIDLMREHIAYSPESGQFHWLKKGLGRRKSGPAGGVSGGYIRVKVLKKMFAAHRLAWAFTHGAWPEDQIDHINLDPLDNRIANLRPCTNAENARNRRAQRGRRSSLKGACWNPGNPNRPWSSHIRADGRLVRLGTFKTPEEAHAAYVAAVEEYHGEFARTA